MHIKVACNYHDSVSWILFLVWLFQVYCATIMILLDSIFFFLMLKINKPICKLNHRHANVAHIIGELTFYELRFVCAMKLLADVTRFR